MFPVVNGRKQCYILPMELQTKTLSIFGRLCPPKVLLHSENGLNEPKMINVAIRTQNAIFVV